MPTPPGSSTPSIPAPGVGPTFRVDRCDVGDREAQTRLFNACFKKRIEPRALVWRYDENPHGKAASFMTRVAGDDTGVSGYACSPRIAVPYGDDAHKAPIGETGDVMTHPEWRKRGLFSDLDRAAREETARLGWPLMFGLPNRRSAHIFLELGWERIGTVRPWTFVVVDGPAAREERGREGRLQRWTTALGARRGARARRELAQRGAAYATREVDRFPPDVERLSRAVEPRHSLMVRRDARYLDWRFRASPSGLHRVIVVKDARGELAGYVVVQVPRSGESIGYLVDVLAPESAALAAAISAGLDRLEAEGAALVRATAIDGSWWNGRLVEAGFLAPKRENHLIVILYVHQPDHPLAPAARDTTRWYLTDGDRDDETMG